ncbi:hypothetical protein ACQI5H_10140 [Mycobacterium heidelbergense]|uniref:hypothetical protein n=1 Tax=Mycobacterium heidelbergense TaxID=53376 RepID=UPI003CF52392
MSKLRFGIAAMMAALGPVTFAAGGIARADPPAPGDGCTVLHATTKDVNSRMMWCNPTMTGDHTLVWQYGGPSAP